MRACVRACVTASQSIFSPPVLLPAMSFCHQLLNAESVDHSASRRQEYIPALSDRTARLGLSFIHTPTRRTAVCSHSSRTLKYGFYCFPSLVIQSMPNSLLITKTLSWPFSPSASVVTHWVLILLLWGRWLWANCFITGHLRQRHDAGPRASHCVHLPS